MKHILDTEYHPVIEDFISEFVDDEMEPVAKSAFDELLVFDDDIRDLAFAAKNGKQLLKSYRKTKNFDGFLARLKSRIADSTER